MATHARLMTVLCLAVTAWTAGAAPTWQDPWMTASKDDYVIKVNTDNSELTIYEDVPIGHQIAVLHVNAAEGEKVTVTAEDGVQLEFTENAPNIKVTLASQLDFERPKTDIITTVKLNGGNSQTLIIHVEDVNDNPPRFDGGIGSQVNLNVPEDSTNDSLLVLKATDADQGGTKVPSYTLTTVNPELFTLTSPSDGCQLHLIKPMDYETSRLYTLTITATDAPDGRGLRQNVSVTVNINVQDVGDTPPLWNSPAATKVVDETVPKGALIFSVLAIDGDLGVNNPIVYSITKQNPDSIMTIDTQSGAVTLLKDLDREDPAIAAVNGFISVVVQARESPADKPDQPCSNITCATSTGIITVNDMDDHIPTFDSPSYPVTIDENWPGMLGLKINVTDPDSRYPNGAFDITLEGAPEGVFEAAATKGAQELITDIRVMNPDYLDYEVAERQTIKFKVVATGDNEKKSSSSSDVIITLNDVNDNSPVFEKDAYAVSIKESCSSGDDVIAVAATDADITPEFGNASIRYSIVGSTQTDAIKIDDTTGDITMSASETPPFDYENEHSVKYTIRAVDGGNKSRTSSVELTINIEDVDDTPPTITPSLSCSVKENKENVKLTPDIEGKDVDTDAELTFSIDWSNTKAYKDGKEVAKDDYDFTKCFHIGTQAAPPGGATGTLSVTGEAPDREKMDSIQLSVVVTDEKTVSGTKSATGTVTVTILDENDNYPTFINVNNTTEMNVTENVPDTSVIFTVLAEDSDKDNTITYRLDGNPAFTSLVAIGEGNGQLSVIDNIDREKHSQIELTVTATDSGVPPKNSSIKITIAVLDQNDCPPVWKVDPSTLLLNVSEQGTPNKLITTLQATDNDLAGTPFSNVTYSVSKESSDNITVDAISGEVRVNGVLDREALPESDYVLTVRVQAGDNCDTAGRCRHTIDGYLRVRVLDINDQPPVFPAPSGDLAKVPETTREHVFLATVTATDADARDTPAAKLQYGLAETVAVRSGCQRTDLFTAGTEGDAAQLLSSHALQGCWGTYNVTLWAADSEAPFHNVTAVYQVQVDDVNDPPEFVSPADGFSLGIWENSYNGSQHLMPIVLTNGTELVVVAKDPDIPKTQNSKLQYSLLQSSTPEGATNIFDVIPSSGVVCLKSKVDRESPAGYEYTLVVEARDRGEDGGLAATTHLHVTVKDVDEFAPRFPDDNVNYDARFKENQAAGSVTLDVTTKATDADDTDIMFFFLVGGAKDTFELVNHDAPVPQLRTTRQLDREKQPSYLLILATSRNNTYPGDVAEFDASDKSTLLLNVTVQDMNDNTPTFSGSTMGGIAAGDEKKVVIVALSAIDPDLNDTTSYRIEGAITASDPSIEPVANTTQPFVLEPDTGKLLLNFDVDSKMNGYFEFTASATDLKDHSSETVVRVFIITEENRVKFIFANAAAFVTSQQEKVRQILSKVFGYTANIETVLTTSDSTSTDVTTHFIDEQRKLPVDRDTIINMQYQGDVSRTLIEDFSAIDLNLTHIGDTKVAPLPEQDTLFQMLLIVVASVLGGLLALTLITACIKTTKLRRQVKALSINAFGSKESGMQNAGLAVPGSNMFANQGANPIFTLDERQNPDAESVSSGDSVLIGVEDAAEFGGPAAKRPAPSAPVAPPASAASDAGFGDQAAKRLAPSAPVTPPASAVFDVDSPYHMPQFEADEEFGDAGVGASPFGGDVGVGASPFGSDGGATCNPLFGAELPQDEGSVQEQALY
ncbi:cadherin-23-like [Pollicipes pollicipes]|uniref:cadherin-23-like n=1 Tax=Pollicipes pollicipes TaxID=41117 RepID=UPI00188507FE|nr:cadherin-23-like [Pollicipes pollicipes]